ncbi:hypothetical protein CVIRNUC_004766 [Coccomyxa viridis]|uniref:Uncharacterized protein n=1 Tax=Coccomyxa viridis TaxID=1274662 RepID=A0AAV1I2J6_9CHLO|nr:hypothetical protein CVIRNUC_004766 [Coccomyxa viridis]
MMCASGHLTEATLAFTCRRVFLGWLGLAVLLASLAGMAFHTREMWAPALSDAIYGTRHGFRVNHYGRQVDDHDEGNVHLIGIDSQRSEAGVKALEAPLPPVDREESEVNAAGDVANAASSASIGRPTDTGQEGSDSMSGSAEGAQQSLQGADRAGTVGPGAADVKDNDLEQPAHSAIAEADERLAQRPT